MAIIIEGKEVNEIHDEGYEVQERWQYIKGAWRLIWQAIRSCFGRGFWANDKSWSNTDGFRNM